MDKLNQVKQLSVQAEKQFTSKNYEVAFNLYNKMVSLLIDYLQKQPFNDQREGVMNQIKKYVELRAESQELMIKNNQNKKIVIDYKGGPQNNNNPNQPHIQVKKPTEEKHKIQPLNIVPLAGQQKPVHNTITGKPITASFILPEKPVEPQPNKHWQQKPKPHQPKKHQPPVIKEQLKKKQAKKQNKDEIPEQIQQLIMRDIKVRFSDIVGLKDVKSALDEAVIRPRKRPDLYKGIRAPPKGLLLYGPPGNGKTYICKALANESGCTFFALSASSILNKYVGQSEKMIKKVFAAAAKMHPSIIFIDEIDSMLTARSQNENESSRRLKTQFLVLMDGISSPDAGDVIVIGATNLPKQLDSAAKRRFAKFIFIGPPDEDGRREIIQKNLKELNYNLSEEQMKFVVKQLDGFSASEIRNIIAEVSMMPLRDIRESKIMTISSSKIRGISTQDFLQAMKGRKPIVSKEQVEQYRLKV